MPRTLWNDDRGFIISVELLFIVVILIVGIVGGLTALRGAMLSAVGDLGDSISGLDPGYSIAGVASSTGSSNGSLFVRARKDRPSDAIIVDKPVAGKVVEPATDVMNVCVTP